MNKKEFLGRYKVQKIGDTLMITIPRAFALAIGLEGGRDGDRMSIYRQGDQMIAEKDKGDADGS